MAKVFCSKCGAELGDDYPICPYCKTPRQTQTPWEPNKAPTRQKKSVLLLISAILGILYAIYIVSYFAGAPANAGGAAEAIGAGIATALVMPHMLCAVLAAIFNTLGWAGL